MPLTPPIPRSRMQGVLGTRLEPSPGAATGARLGYTLVALAGIAFIVWLGEWTLMGYRF